MPPRKHKTVALVSLGCPKNLVDSERMLARLAEGGYVVGAPMDRADVIVVNTCGFLDAARQESLAVIRQALARRRTRRGVRVVVAGCLVNRDAEALFDAVPGIAAIVGVNDRDSILDAVAGRRRTLLTACDGRTIAADAGRFRLTPPHTAYLRIAEGCSHRCTFCTIPSIRGPLRSKTPDAVLAEARELVADGAKELNIIAQDTTSYGRDVHRRGVSLASLLRRLDEESGAEWLRLLYTHPRYFTDATIDAMADCPHVVPYVDLPLQHVADGVLKRMGRRTTRRDIEALLGKLRRKVKGIAIRTTFIVGFPGETEAEFEELLAFVKDFRFEALGVFPYSLEAGTPAARLPRRVPDAVAAQRRDAVMRVQQEIAFAANRARKGRPVLVLVDGADPAGRCVGRTATQAPDVDSVCILLRPQPTGAMIYGTVTGADGYDLLVAVDGKRRTT